MVVFTWSPSTSSHTVTAHGNRRFLAVAPHPADSEIMASARMQRPAYASLQIWSLGPDDGSNDDPGVTRCEMVVCVDAGPAQEIKWCPLPSHSTVSLDGVCPTYLKAVEYRRGRGFRSPAGNSRRHLCGWVIVALLHPGSKTIHQS